MHVRSEELKPSANPLSGPRAEPSVQEVQEANPSCTVRRGPAPGEGRRGARPSAAALGKGSQAEPGTVTPE